jgi:hypothetical protein
MTEEKKHNETETEKISALDEEILEELDLEEWVKARKKPCKAKRYHIRIDKEKITVSRHSMTGKEILALVGKTPELYTLREVFHGGKIEEIKQDQVVEFHRCEVERFVTLKREATEG